MFFPSVSQFFAINKRCVHQKAEKKNIIGEREFGIRNFTEVSESDRKF